MGAEPAATAQLPRAPLTSPSPARRLTPRQKPPTALRNAAACGQSGARCGKVADSHGSGMGCSLLEIEHGNSKCRRQ